MSHVRSGTHSVESILDERVCVGGGLLFVSGLTAADPRSGIPPTAAVSPEYPYYGADIQKQTSYVLEKLTKLLSAHGARLEDVVKTQVFLTDCGLFDAFDQVWKRFFPVPPPRTTVGVGADAMAVPRTLVAVDVIAALPGKADVRHIDSPRLPKPLANYTPCVAAGDWLFLAGQLPTEFGVTGLAPAAAVNTYFPHHVSPLVAQAKYTIGICQTLLEDAGSDWNHTIRAHVFLKNVAEAPLFEALWNEHFDGTPPPFLIIGVDELLTGGAEIEIDVIAVPSGAPIRREDLLNGHQPVAGRVMTAGSEGTIFSLTHIDIDATEYRLFAIEQAISAAIASASEQAGRGVRPLKVHAFLPDPSDIFGFGRGLPTEVRETAAITTSPSVGSSRIGLEVVYGFDR